MSDNYEIIEVEFRSLGSTGTHVGIVLTKNSIGEISCRIGQVVDQENIILVQKYDALRIAACGGKLFRDEAIGFFPQHKDLILKKWKDG